MKYLKYGVLYILLINVFIPNLVHCQGTPVFNQQVYFPQTFNPSRYGDGFLLLNYRRQWLGLPGSIAPVTLNLNADLTEMLTLGSKKIALGFGFLSDQAHLARSFDGRISFAYHLIESENTRLSLGINAGILSQRIRLTPDTRIDDISQSFEGSSNLIGAAGPGLFYRTKSMKENIFELDASLPRLYSSQNAEDTDIFIDVTPHLLLRSAFSMKYGSSSFGPVVLFKRILSGSRSDFNDKGHVDFAIRGGILDEQFWLGLGTRFHLGLSNANQMTLPLQFTFGANAFDGGSFMGSFDFGSNFGPSVEFGFFYNFKEKEATNSRKIARNEINACAAEAEKIWRTLSDMIKGKLIDLGNIETKIRALSSPPLTGKNDDVRKLNDELSLIKEWSSIELTKVLAPLRVCNDKRNQYQLENLIPRKLQAADLIESRLKEADADRALIDKAINSRINELKTLKSKLPLEISEIITSRPVNFSQIDTYLNSEILKVAKRPRGLEKIKVEQTDKGFSITYRFPNAIDRYYLAKDPVLDDVKSLLDFCAKNITEFSINGLNPDSISYIVLLRDDETVAEKIKRGTYSGEYGPMLDIKYTLNKIVNNLPVFSNKKLTLKSGTSTNLVQMAVLKTYSMKEYLSKFNGFDPGMNFIQLVSPEKELNSSQQFKIVVYYSND